MISHESSGGGFQRRGGSRLSRELSEYSAGLAEGVGAMLSEFRAELAEDGRQGERERAEFMRLLSADVLRIRTESIELLDRAWREHREMSRASALDRAEYVESIVRWADEAHRRSREFSAQLRRERRERMREGVRERAVFIESLLDWADEFQGEIGRFMRELGAGRRRDEREGRRERARSAREARDQTRGFLAGLRADRAAASRRAADERSAFADDLRAADADRRANTPLSGVASGAVRRSGPARGTRARPAVTAAIMRAGSGPDASPARTATAVDFRAQLAADAPGLTGSRSDSQRIRRRRR